MCPFIYPKKNWGVYTLKIVALYVLLNIYIYVRIRICLLVFTQQWVFVKGDSNI